MALTVVGTVPYRTTIDGSTYLGITIHCVEPAKPEKGGIGQTCFSFSVGSTKPGYVNAIRVVPGDTVNPIFNRYGKVEDVSIVSVPSPDTVSFGSASDENISSSVPSGAEGSGKESQGVSGKTAKTS